MESRAKPKGFYSSSFWDDYLVTQQGKLPLLRSVDDRLSPRVVRFLGGNPGKMQLQGTNTYLVGTGKSRILIDTGEGYPSWILNIVEYLEDHDICITHVLLTHWHRDHTGGVEDLLLYDPGIIIHKNTPNSNQRAIQDGQIFSTDGATLSAVLSPGHTTDHTCFILEEEHALFTGDNVLGHGYSVAEDLGAYTRSIRLLGYLGCNVGYPGHGDMIKNLSLVIKRYVTQRESRERSILDILVRSEGGSKPGRDSVRQMGDGWKTDAAHGLSVMDISTLLYGEIAKDTATFESALEPLVSQVLCMLAEFGKVDYREAESNGARYWFAKNPN